MHPLITESLNENISIEEAHKQIDKAIEQYRENILALKSHRNRYAPFSRLPPEIICKIFTFAKIPGLDYYWRGQPMKLIKLTHVTRHWRSVALNSPSLWTDLPVGNGNPLLIEEMLKRSKDASLAINCDLATIHHMRPGLELALQHSARAKEMFFRNVRSSMWNDLQKHLSQPTPRLEYLALEGSAPVPFFDYGTATKPERISITGHVLCETGRLHHLELINCTVDWTSHSHIFHSLTHLKLHNIPNTLRPNGKQFVDILKGMPDLEYLDLKDVLPIQTGEKMPWASDHIHFPSLRTLKLCSTNKELEPFFSCVTFPPTTAVNIVCSATVTSANTPISTSHFSPFIMSLGQSYSNCSSAPTFQTIILPKIGLGSELHLKLFTDELANDWSFYTGTSIPSLELQFLWKSVTQDIGILLHDIFDGAIHLRHVKRVYLADLEHGLAVNTIANTFGTLPCVRSVVAASGAAESFINALKLRLHDDKMEPTIADPTPTLYFPRLSSISLLDVNFNGGLDGLTIENLQDCLIQRYEYGAEIEKLTLSDCIRLSEEDVDLLSEIVVDVDWDGLEVFTEDEEEDDDEDEEEDDYTDPYHEFADEDYDGSLYGDGDPLDFW
ncbi:hypothetical protein BJ912DRAFT_1141215 [Pholiota molesta]|nr:hypothetical protein BJ912DRAFT_1141215 [Pholiota molesta]